MPTADKNRRGEILHQNEIAAAHVAPIGLQQKGFAIGRHLLHRAIIEQPLVAAIRIVPDRVRVAADNSDCVLEDIRLSPMRRRTRCADRSSE